MTYYNAIFSKSFSRPEQKKFGYFAIIGSFILALGSFSLLRPYLGPLPILNLRLSMGPRHETMLVTEDTSNSQLLDIVNYQPLMNTSSSYQSNMSSSQPTDIGDSHQSNISSTQSLSTSSSEPSQQANISSSEPLKMGNSQQSNMSSSEPSNINSSHPLSTSSSHANVSSSQPENVDNSQQSNINSSQSLSTSSSQQPNTSNSQLSNIGNSQPANIDNSQQSDMSSSKPTTVGNSLPENVNDSQPEKVSNSLTSNVDNSQPESVGNSQPESVGNSQPESVGNSQPKDVGNSQQEEVGNSQQEDVGNSQPEDVGNSQPENVGNSQPEDIGNQQEDVGNSQPEDVGNSQPENVGNSQLEDGDNSQQENVGNSQPEEVGNSQPENVDNSQQENVGNSQPENVDNSQPENVGNSQQSNVGNSDQPLDKSNSQSSDGHVTLKPERKPICDVLNPGYDYCDAEGDVRIQGVSSTVFAIPSQMDGLVENESWTVKPYPRKRDHTAMGNTNAFTVKAIGAHEEAPTCALNHSVPAIIFSAGGYAGNHFHSFTDIIIPLYVASAQFRGEVQFVVTNFAQYWIDKFQGILKELSNYKAINIDTDQTVHCFPRVIVGLQQYKDMRIDPLMASKGYSMKEFRELMRKAYSLKKLTAIKIDHPTPEKPRLLIISRQWSRAFVNVNEIAEMARSLGFEVVVAEATMDLYKFSQEVNSCDVMMGVHGAGLTNLVFLPSNAILIQILPWGGFEWLASTYFAEPALDMEIRYLEYKIKAEESSLLEQYPLDHPVFMDPSSVHKSDWGLFKSIYLDKQNVKLDLDRFRPTLVEALGLLHH